MAKFECRSVQKGVPSKWVTVKKITDAQAVEIRSNLDELLRMEAQASDAVAKAFVHATDICRAANPSDIWQHVIYRHLLACGWNDAKWKRVAGFALERAFAQVYSPRLEPHGIRMQILQKGRADEFLSSIGVDVRSTKIDLFLETGRGDNWKIFGAAHVKGSIAERIQDDVPASLALMRQGLLSVGLTLDAKSFPPPHGDCVNYGELGGRSFETEKARIKRDYVEKHGQFDGLFSFNLRTPSSGEQTPSGKRIYTLGLHDKQPDQFVRFLLNEAVAHSKLSIG
jgi:hypothetical protein